MVYEVLVACFCFRCDELMIDKLSHLTHPSKVTSFIWLIVVFFVYRSTAVVFSIKIPYSQQIDGIEPPHKA